MTRDTAYLDSSAIVKLVVEEAESADLRVWTNVRPRVASSALATTEVLRAVRRQSEAVRARARLVLERVTLIAVDDAILEAAATLDPEVLRSLDAIHLAAARSLGDDLLAIVTYDDRMAEGARLLGLPVERPGVVEGFTPDRGATEPPTD